MAYTYANKPKNFAGGSVHIMKNPAYTTYSQLYRYDNHKDRMDSLENHHPVLSFITAFFHWLSLINQRVSRLQLTRILLSDQTLP